MRGLSMGKIRKASAMLLILALIASLTFLTNGMVKPKAKQSLSQTIAQLFNQP
jgi:hypothetical protein